MLLHANKIWRRLDMFLTRHTNSVLFCSIFAFLESISSVLLKQTLEVLSRSFLEDTSVCWWGAGFVLQWQNTWKKKKNWNGGRAYTVSWCQSFESMYLACAPWGMWWGRTLQWKHMVGQDAYFILIGGKKGGEGAWVLCVFQDHAPNSTSSSEIISHHEPRGKLVPHELVGNISDWNTSEEATVTG